MLKRKERKRGLAMLTNVRPTHGEQKPELPKSRGDLVRLVLEGQEVRGAGRLGHE